jgi:hypothetical protein
MISKKEKESLKNYIRNRDKNKCQNPLCKNKTKKNLIIHHIDYDKKNCEEHNLITLCRSCHGKSNHNRTFHRNFYSEIMCIHSLEQLTNQTEQMIEMLEEVLENIKNAPV